MTSPTEGKLILTGWLSDKEKLAVSQASPNNPVLVAAVSKLYTQVVNYVPGLTAPKFITSTDAEQLLREPDVEARYLTILLRLVPHLELDLVTAQLSSALGLDQQVIGRLLDTVKIHARSAKDLLTDSDFLRSDSKNRPQRTPGFTVDDLRDLAGLVGQFNKAAAPSLSAYLWSRIPTAAQTRVQDLTLGVDQRSSVLVDALNTIVKGASIYDAALFSVVPLSSETQVLVTQNPTGSDLVRLNGILLAEAYPLEIARKWPSQFEVLELLGKVASIGNSLAIQPDQWDWVLSSPFTIMDIRKLPTSTVSESASFDAWRQLVDLFHLRDVLSDGPARLFKIATALKASDFATVRKEFAAAFELSETEVIGACSSDLLAFKSTVPDEDYHNPSRLLQLAQLLHVIKALGTTAPNITQLINSAPGESVAQLARNLFAASIDASALPDRMRPISNRLRHLQRDALVAYLINHDHLETSNELFDRYLIDVEMGACMLTSRMKQAISSVQLFVQRCLLNLERPVHPGEPGVSPISIDSRRWQWMKYYRVWEANRKVFLYPENWIEPELRDDKSEIFQALESDLLQSELTHDTALLAFRKYVDALGDVARLTVIGMFDEKIGDDALVHIVARDNSQPYKHYYRQWRLGPTYVYGNWTSWEEISTQVDSEHVVVFVHAGNVHLAWPTITKKQTEVSWSVRMNLARRTATGWTKLRKGRGELSCSMTPNKDEANSLAFRFSQNPPSIEYFGPMVKWVAPHSPESQFTQFEPTQFILVPGKSESESAGRVENLAARKLDLRVRILRKYTDLNGVVFYDVAKPSDAKVTATILGMWLLSSFKSPLPFIVERELRPPKPPGFGIDYGGVFSIFNDMWDLGPLSSFGLPYSNAAAIYAQQMIGLRASISTPGVIYKKQELRSEFKTLEKDAAWNIDFIFETDESKISDDHPELGANRQLSLSKIGSFLLKDDVSFDLLKAQAGGALESPPLQGTEHYSSGYREIPNAGDHALTVGGGTNFFWNARTIFYLPHRSATRSKLLVLPR